MTKERKIFQEKYPAKEVAENPFIAVEAVGYLKHLEVTKPEQSEWIDKTIIELLTVSSIAYYLQYR
jgi:hypothetical protein